MIPFLLALAVLSVSVSVGAVDHSHILLDRALAEFVENGLVDYAGLQRSAANVDSDFSRYLEELADGSEENWSEDQRLAYWINAYNVFTLRLIIDHYPIRTRWYMKVLPVFRWFLPTNSILMIKGRWDAIKFESVRGPITLGDIEHEILRPEFHDARIHFAIVCGSIGCPDLRSVAFHADSVQGELDETTRDFFANPEKVHIDPDGDLQLSKILEWFREDFDQPPARETSRDTSFEKYGDDAGVARWLAVYGPSRLKERIRKGPFEFGHLGYDWSLNEQESVGS